mgnify:CR=1 FL=1
MKLQNLIIKEEEYSNHKYYALYIVLENGVEYLLGTLKNSSKINYVNCVHRDFKKN